MPETAHRVAQISQMTIVADDHTGSGNFSAPADYQQRLDDYTSPGYETAEDQVDMDINAGVGSISVRPSGG